MLNLQMQQLGATRSCIRELFEYGLRQAAIVGRENVFDYSIGNPSIPAPPAVNEAISEHLRTQSSLSLHGYTPAAGAFHARAAVAENLNERFAAGARAEDIFLCCGAAAGLISVIRALSVPGAEIIGIAPYFPEYKPFVEQNGCKFLVVPADTEHFQIRLDSLEKFLNANTQAVLINSPNNPSGTVYTADTLAALANILRRASNRFGHPIYLISDEPYRELVYDGIVAPFVPKIYENTIVCYSWSKSLSLPGERIGYVYVPSQCADAREVFAAVAGSARILGHVCPPSLMQQVIASCICCAPDLSAYAANRALLYSSLVRMGYTVAKPDGAFYLFVKAPYGDGDSFSETAKRENLLIVPGRDFGCADYVRICYCVSHDMIQRSLPVFQKLIYSRP